MNREVTSADVKYAIERSFSVSVTNGYVSLYFSDLVGYPAKPPKTPQPVAGIKTPDKYTIVFRHKGAGHDARQRAGDDEHRARPKEYAAKTTRRPRPTTGSTRPRPARTCSRRTVRQLKGMGYMPGRNAPRAQPELEPASHYRPGTSTTSK